MLIIFNLKASSRFRLGLLLAVLCQRDVISINYFAIPSNQCIQSSLIHEWLMMSRRSEITKPSIAFHSNIEFPYLLCAFKGRTFDTRFNLLLSQHKTSLKHET